MVTVGSIRSHRQFGNRGASAHQQIAGHGADPRSLVEHDLKLAPTFPEHALTTPVDRWRKEEERPSLEASVARPAFRGVEVAVQLPSRRVESRRPPKLRPSGELARRRLPVLARAARLGYGIDMRR